MMSLVMVAMMAIARLLLCLLQTCKLHTSGYTYSCEMTGANQQ